MKIYETQHGKAKLKFAMIDIDGTNLEEAIQIFLDDEFIGNYFSSHLPSIDEMTIEEVEELLILFI